jgi:hypothetical protein
MGFDLRNHLFSPGVWFLGGTSGAEELLRRHAGLASPEPDLHTVNDFT